jgi:hypothetical protein
MGRRKQNKGGGGRGEKVKEEIKNMVDDRKENNKKMEMRKQRAIRKGKRRFLFDVLCLKGI